MGCRLIIFDCDGVVIDSELLSVQADIECLAEYGVSLSADAILDRYTGISLAAMLGDLEARYGLILPEFAVRHQIRLRSLFEASLRPMPGLDAVLALLACPACIASSGSPERLRHALSLVGLFDRFAPNIFSAAEVARGKPAPDLFLYAAAQMGVAPRDCVVVEDSAPGVAGAVDAGMAVVGFTGGSHCRPGLDSRLAAAGAGVVVDNMAHLLGAVARSMP